MFVLLVLAWAVCTTATSFEESSFHELSSIPGWPPNEPLPSKLYVGYANLTKAASPETTMLMHYLVFLSERDPAVDPVLVWFNGGPGATSAWGLFVENGPLQLNEASLLGEEYAKTGIPQLVLNPYRWTTFATIVVLEAPPPIGFSYCTPPGPAGNGTACGTWNDTRCGVANAEALDIIFNKQLPQLLNGSSKLFFMGESYAGVFISETIQQILSDPDYASLEAKLSGVALGDACLGTNVLCGGANGWYTYLLFMYGHGQFPTELWEALQYNCSMDELKHAGPLSPACQSVVTACEAAIGNFYAYNLYDQCINDMFSAWPTRGKTTISSSKLRRQQLLSCNASMLPTPFVDLDGYWCPGHVFDEYFRHPSVRKAFFVPEDKFFFNSDNAVGMQYVFNEQNVLPLYRRLLENTTKQWRVMIYNGDADPAVNMFETESIWYKFAKDFQMNKTSPWRPWTTGDRIVGGSVTEWEKKVNEAAAGTLWYVTVRGSGHMVPEYRPLAAKVMTQHWLQGMVLPR